MIQISNSENGLKKLITWTTNHILATATDILIQN